MLNRALVSCGAVVGLLLLGPVGPLAQESRTTSASKAWKVPRTAWGHPDLQGIWTTDEEIGVPFERPVDLGEKAILTEAEYTQRVENLKKHYNDDKTDRAGEVGNEQGPVHWYEGAKHISYRTSLVIDPPNGRLPEYTAAAKQRVVPKSTGINEMGSHTGGTYDGPEDLDLMDRCITRGLPHTWLPSEYNNGFQILQTPDHVVIFPERLHEARVIPFNGPPWRDPRAVDGGIPCTVGGQHPGGRRDKHERSDLLEEIAGIHSAIDRALHARRSGHRKGGGHR